MTNVKKQSLDSQYDGLYETVLIMPARRPQIHSRRAAGGGRVQHYLCWCGRKPPRSFVCSAGRLAAQMTQTETLVQSNAWAIAIHFDVLSQVFVHWYCGNQSQRLSDFSLFWKKLKTQEINSVRTCDKLSWVFIHCQVRYIRCLNCTD